MYRIVKIIERILFDRNKIIFILLLMASLLKIDCDLSTLFDAKLTYNTKELKNIIEVRWIII